MGTVKQGCSLFMWCPNRSTGDCRAEVQPVFCGVRTNPPPRVCRAGVQPVYGVLEPTSRGLSAREVASLSGVPTYLPGIFVRVQPIYEVSVSTFRGLLGRDAACLCGVRTYLGMSFIPKPVLIFAFYNASKPSFGPFV